MTASTSATPDTTGPSDAAAEHEVLTELRTLGEELKRWRFVKTAEGMTERARIRAEIRPLLVRGSQAGFTQPELAEALAVNVSHLPHIRHENPQGRASLSGSGETLTPRLRARLSELASGLVAWRHAKSEEAAAERARIRAEIRDTVNHSGATMDDIAAGLGISLQHLCTGIMGENTTGRRKVPATSVQLDPALRARLQELGRAWNPTDRTGLLEARDVIREDVLTALKEARKAGLTIAEIASVSGISYGQISTILRSNPTGRNRG